MERLNKLKLKHNEIEELLKNTVKEAYRERDTAQKYFDVAEVILLVLNKKNEVVRINNKGVRVWDIVRMKLLEKVGLQILNPRNKEKFGNLCITRL